MKKTSITPHLKIIIIKYFIYEAKIWRNWPMFIKAIKQEGERKHHIEKSVENIFIGPLYEVSRK